MASVTKACSKCGIDKPLSEYSIHRSSPDGLRYSCRECQHEATKVWRKNNREAYLESCRRSNMKKNYGLTLEQYDKMYSDQCGECKICGVFRERLHVDHCHTTGEVRDLLCSQCNVAIGYAKEDENILRSMIEYIGRWS